MLSELKSERRAKQHQRIGWKKLIVYMSNAIPPLLSTRTLNPKMKSVPFCLFIYLLWIAENSLPFSPFRWFWMILHCSPRNKAVIYTWKVGLKEWGLTIRKQMYTIGKWTIERKITTEHWMSVRLDYWIMLSGDIVYTLRLFSWFFYKIWQTGIANWPRGCKVESNKIVPFCFPVSSGLGL